MTVVAHCLLPPPEPPPYPGTTSLAPRPKKSKNKRPSEKDYIPPLLDHFPLNPITTAEADPHRDAFPVAHSPAFPNATLLNLVWLEAQGMIGGGGGRERGREGRLFS